jgi:CRP/FNR family transcriptional regulator
MKMDAPPGRKFLCEKCPLQQISIFRKFAPSEAEFVSAFKSGELNVEAGATILLQGTNSAHLYTVLSGWAFRYKMLPDGRRQILNFALPGDFLGLQASVLDEMQHSVEALTNMVLCIFPREKLWALYSEHPRLAFDVTWLSAREEQVLADHLVSVGQRTAVERTAYLLLHMFLRAEELGLTKSDSVEFPFNQQHVADALGMSLVHANRTLQRLRARKLIRWKDRVFQLLDRDALMLLAQYDSARPQGRPFI